LSQKSSQSGISGGVAFASKGNFTNRSQCGTVLSGAGQNVSIQITSTLDKDLDILIKNCGDDTKEKVYLLSRLVAKLRNRESKLQVKYNSMKHLNIEEMSKLESKLNKEK